MGCIQINSLKNKKNNILTNQLIKEVNKNKFIEEALKQHNKLRNEHHAENLIIEEKLQNYAQNFAEELANKNEEYHSQCELEGKIIGENIFVSNNNNITGEKMTNDFYNEINNYDFNKGECVINASRFTQLVWKNSKEVGFGIAKSKSGKIYVVVNYYPAGNNLGEYKENVENKN
jgi:uncharacterized protein YkwD